jgi:hypothetical protein
VIERKNEEEDEMRLASLILAGIALTCVLLLQGSNAMANGIGAYPARIEVADGARGSIYYEDFGVMNSDPTDLLVKPIADGDVGAWTTIVAANDRTTPMAQLVIPAGSTSSFLARIEVPSTASNGVHDGSLTLQSLGPASPAAGADPGTVFPAIELNLGVTISGDQNLAGKILDLYTNDTEVGYPLRVTTYFSNIGNVDATPKVTVRVKDASSVIVGDSNNSSLVPSGGTSFILNVWDTTGHADGDYVADVAVNLGDATIEERTLNFKILPYGTITRRGSLESLTLANDPKLGGTAKVEANFRNSGIIDTHAIFQGEIYRDGSLVTAVTTPEKLVAPGDLASIETFIQLTDNGNYVVRGKVNYDGKETDEQELSFSVSSGTPWALIGGVAVGGTLVLGAGIGVPWRMRRKKSRLAQRQEPAPGT